MQTQRDLSLAYTPGVAEPCLDIAQDTSKVFDYTARGNLVAVISAVLGLGDIGPEASKPVMAGKGVLFKRFADIDVFDIEVAETDPDKFIEIVAALEPTFGGINLEDIKAPECFYIEEALRERMKILVFMTTWNGDHCGGGFRKRPRDRGQETRRCPLRLQWRWCSRNGVRCVVHLRWCASRKPRFM